MGREAEAAKLLPEMLKHADDATGATVDGLICGDELEKAELLALASLGDEDFAKGFLRSLQREPLTSDDPSAWQSGWKALRDRPAIAAAFDRLGRDLPAPLRAPRPNEKS